MKHIILFLTLISLVNADFTRDCVNDPPSCKVEDFAFDDEYVGNGVCDGYAKDVGTDPTGATLNIVDSCDSIFDSCQIAAELPFKCDVVLLSLNRDACRSYKSTATCQYSPQNGWIIGLSIVLIVLVVFNLITCVVGSSLMDSCSRFCGTRKGIGMDTSQYSSLQFTGRQRRGF